MRLTACCGYATSAAAGTERDRKGAESDSGSAAREGGAAASSGRRGGGPNEQARCAQPAPPEVAARKKSKAGQYLALREACRGGQAGGVSQPAAAKGPRPCNPPAVFLKAGLGQAAQAAGQRSRKMQNGLACSTSTCFSGVSSMPGGCAGTCACCAGAASTPSAAAGPCAAAGAACCAAAAAAVLGPGAASACASSAGAASAAAAAAPAAAGPPYRRSTRSSSICRMGAGQWGLHGGPGEAAKCALWLQNCTGRCRLPGGPELENPTRTPVLCNNSTTRRT